MEIRESWTLQLILQQVVTVAVVLDANRCDGLTEVLVELYG